MLTNILYFFRNNHIYSIVLLFSLFLIYYHIRGWMCPCGLKKTKPIPIIPCKRVELFNIQPGNLLMIPIGYYFSRKRDLILIISLHFLWELYQYLILDPYSSFFGGCYDKNKHLNFWHVTIQDLISRPIFLFIGYLIYNYMHQK